IFGVDYTWDVDGVLDQGLGDLYRYKYKPGQPVMLGAHHDQQVATAQLHVGEGFVDSSNNVGCAIAAPGGRQGTRAAGGLAAIARLGRVPAGPARRPRRRRAASA